MKPTVYIETTIPSYLAAAPSRDLVVAAHQQVTHDWWDRQSQHCSLFISQFVLDEASRGDPEVAQRRRQYIEGIPLLDVTEATTRLAQRFLSSRLIPVGAETDAVHIAVATVSGIHFLLTWNCKHIANAALTDRLRALCHTSGYALPVICTPEELMEL